MKLIIGLGNPGEKYAKTRHNVGFIILDEIQKKLEFPHFEFNKKFNALVSEKNIAPKNNTSSLLSKLFSASNQEKIILVKPQTFMNNSGESIRAILDFYKLSSQNLIIINDDLDILVGKYKISTDSSAHGHNGVQSIIDHVGTQNIKRVKIGVEKESGRASRQTPGEQFVLDNFTSDELNKVTSLTNQIISEIL
ncbi:MAG TPA: aminoacyl-tRNA hydrolase [Candidatus Moranbacteria bacterium]|nr:MAG: Peptidyl-tRNA hydrolase [Candidatus Moranbacteria bacterium GW2011_GWF1_34_10]HBI16542.1 aminoacyl-tRNA hydrolase [Candidatus Moranbacteria bacterium]